ncbi:TIGR02679 domain-containing protein [Actinoplanes sp. NPDC051470]|uniref:TIGR02679 domain-containing protein n=1 Tax=unclassified Actinoplanes TaxID=2626549 RepID=UPI0034353D8A
MPDLTADPGWRRLLAAARRSLERTGGDLSGSVSLAAPDETERHIVIGVTGVHRPAGVSRVSVRLAELDVFLRDAYGTDLVSAVGPFRNRPGERALVAEARDSALAMAATSRHAGAPWFDNWLGALRGDGTLTRIARGGLPFSQVLAVLDAMPVTAEPMPVFAERILGDTKALTDGPVRGLVLRALAAWHGTGVPTGAEQERALWELAGVVPDDLASQVLVLNLPASGGPLGDWLSSAAAAHVPFRVTLHQLRLGPLTLPSKEIFVCENPAVLRAAAGRGTAPLICTEGVPSAAVHMLLGYRASDAVIRWRNDFDWTGLRLTGAALARYPEAVPWRMSSADYRTADATGLPLTGVATATAWDPSLAEAMSHADRSVMERAGHGPRKPTALRRLPRRPWTPITGGPDRRVQVPTAEAMRSGVVGPPAARKACRSWPKGRSATSSWCFRELPGSVLRADVTCGRRLRRAGRPGSGTGGRTSPGPSSRAAP